MQGLTVIGCSARSMEQVSSKSVSVNRQLGLDRALRKGKRLHLPGM
jgi:hypothetical protein